MKKTKIIGTIIGVILFAIVIVGITYAYATWSSSNINKQVSSKCFNVLYDKGSDIIGPITPSYDYTGGLSTTIRMNMSTRCDVNAKGILYLDTSSDTSENLFREGLLNYHVVRNGNTVIASGNITESGRIEIDLGNIAHSQTAFTRYEIYIWLNYNLIENSDVNSVYYGNIKAVAVQDEGEYIPPTTRLIDYITNLYVNNNPSLITHKNTSGNKIADYYYASSVNLMNDGLGATVTDTTALINGTEGNIRYYGKNPNNYIYFNCDDYNNQNDSTCEKWRIIGIVEGKVKITKTIGTYSWDYTADGEYDNNWHDSTLQILLNNGYYNNLDGVEYFDSYFNEFDIINFKTSKTGIKDNNTRNMISDSIWYLGGHFGNVYPNSIYTYERQNKKCDNCTYDTTWKGKIALMYPSDFGYTFDLSLCNRDLSNYVLSEGCRNTSWLYGNAFWLITPDSGYDSRVWSFGGGSIVYEETLDRRNIRVALYLDPELIFSGLGNGSSEEPYQILNF